MDNKNEYNSIEREVFVNQLLETNQLLKENSSKTNGKLCIDEVLKKYSNVKEDLRMGEKIRYIAYKTTKKFRFIVIFFTFLTFCLGVYSFYGGVKGFQLNEPFIFFISIAFLTILSYMRFQQIFIITNKSFILGKKNKSTKINYRHIEYIKVSNANNTVTYIIKDAEGKMIQINNYKGSIHSEILTAISEKIGLSKNEKNNKIKIIKIVRVMVIFSSLLMVYLIYQIPGMKEVKIFGYSVATIASLIMILGTIFYLKLFNSAIKKEYEK